MDDITALQREVEELRAEIARLQREDEGYKRGLESLVSARTEQLRKAMADLERSYDMMLDALASALDLKDAETVGHSKRVTSFTIAIAKAMGLTKEQVSVIARGAFLHDIGKLAIPDAILRRPGALGPDEVAIMREYCYRGYQILKRIPFLQEAAEIVYAHQEHFDGTGYPRRLKGDEIPLGAKLVAVANTLDAITSDRPYQPAQSLEAAQAEIRRCSGSQCDPEVVKQFLNMGTDIWNVLRKEIAGQGPHSELARTDWPRLD